MPDEQTVVNEQTANPTAQSNPADTGSPPTEETQQSQESHMVPSGRLKEEADKRRDAEARATRLEHNQQQLAQQNQQLQQYVYRMSQQQQTPANGSTDPVDEVLNTTFGTDEAGQKARRGVELLIEKEIRSKGYVTQQEAAALAQQSAAQATGQWSGTVQTANRIQALINNGSITSDEGGEIQQEISRRLSLPEYQTVSNNPAQMKYVVSDVISEHLEGNKFSRLKPVRPQNPMQPSGGAAPSPPKEEVYDPSVSPFSTIKNLSTEDSEKLTKMSVARNEGGR